MRDDNIEYRIFHFVFPLLIGQGIIASQHNEYLNHYEDSLGESKKSQHKGIAKHVRILGIFFNHKLFY